MNYITRNFKDVLKHYTVTQVLFDFFIAIMVLISFPFFILVELFNFIRNNRGM